MVSTKLKLGKDQVAEYNFKQSFIGRDNLMVSLFFSSIFKFTISVTPSGEVANTIQW